MPHTAYFRFHGNINDFLPSKRKDVEVPYQFRGAPAVKDAIEALGVPHPEVEAIVVNNRAVNFHYSLHANDAVAVYGAGVPFAAGDALRPVRPAEIRFVLDVHLGTLAKMLRMLGFDTCYENDYSDAAIAQLAAQEQRIVLTRDIGLLKQKAVTWGYWLRSQHTQQQLQEVLRRFDLAPGFAPFTRCLSCNGVIKEVPKAEVVEQLPPKTKKYFNEFYQCCGCHKVYWKGSHHQRMQELIKQMSA